jgi:hypothetical protein
LKTPKSAAGIRDVPVEPALVPLLEALRDEARGGAPAVEAMPPMAGWAANFGCTSGATA